MAHAPAPITLSQVPADQYEGEYAPAPLLIVGNLPILPEGLAADLQALPGYNADATQTLGSVDGAIQWVTPAAG